MTLCERHFALRANQVIFRRIRAIAESHAPIDEVTLSYELDRHQELEFVGGRHYIASLTDGAVERRDISHLVNCLQQQAVRRTGIKLGSELQKLAADATASTTAMAERVSAFAAEVTSDADAMPPRFSEESLALRFSRENTDELRYVAGWGRWMCWDGVRWCSVRGGQGAHLR